MSKIKKPNWKSGPEKQPVPARVRAFEVSIAGRDWHETINETNPGRAKQEYHSRLLDAWPDLKFTDLRVRLVGAPKTSEAFLRNAAYRGLPDARCGDRVKVGEATGTIVGHDAASRFEVLFDAASPKYAGLRLSVHPADTLIINKQMEK
jgi:hypothetical protein